MIKQISNGVNKKVVFKKRVPEPKEMGREEMKAFEKMSADSYMFDYDRLYRVIS